MFLIEAIIEILGALFGDQQPQAKVGPRDRRSDDTPRQRGPYDYGDGKSGGGQRPKTLAELLEDARRDAQGGTRPAASAQQVAPPPPPPPSQRRPAPPPEIAPAPRPAQPAYQAQAPARKQRKRRSQTSRTEVAPPQTPQAPARPTAPPPPVAVSAYVTAKEKVGISTTLAPWIKALRTSKGKQKRIVGAQAMMSYEIFGPPRSKRPMIPGQHNF